MVVILLGIGCACAATAQPSGDGRFQVVTNDGTTYVVKVQIKSSSSTAKLGTSTLQFTYNASNLSFPSSPTKGTHYSFAAFDGGAYASNITQPVSGTISLNIVLNSTNSGTVVGTAFTDVATITFTTLTPSGSSNLAWSLEELFSDDNATLWNNGTFTDLNTSPLPVELLSFSGTAHADRVSLLWETASELNNHGFEVERADAVHAWTRIGFVRGSGSVDYPIRYSFDDFDVYASAARSGGIVARYRLRQVDRDGSADYSPVITVRRVLSGASALAPSFPNPAVGGTMLTVPFSLAAPAEARITVEDVLGRRVALMAEGLLDAGTHARRISTRGWTPGVYIIRLDLPDGTLSRMLAVE